MLVYINAAAEPRQMPIANYHELLINYAKKGVDVVSGKEYDLNQRISIDPLTAIIVPLAKAE